MSWDGLWEYPGEVDVCDRGGCDEFDALVAFGIAVEMVEQPFAAVEQDGHDHQVQVVDQAGAEVLLNGGDTTAESDVLSVGGLACSFEYRVDTVIDEVERRPALHGDGRTGVVGEDEHRMVEGRIIAPPAGPFVLTPRSPDRTEHVPSHDGGTDTDIAPRDEAIVDALVTAVHADHLSTGAGSEHPFVQSVTTYAERVVDALRLPGRVSVKRDREVVYA